jgi:hypothetical protein
MTRVAVGLAGAAVFFGMPTGPVLNTLHLSCQMFGNELAVLFVAFTMPIRDINQRYG